MLPHLEALVPLLQVFDIEKSLEFYRDILGFKVLQTYSANRGDELDWAMLAHGDVRLMLNTAYEKQERPETSRVASHADTILYFACDDANAAFEHIQQQGWPVAAPVDTFYGMRQVYLKDPDGFELCFQCITPSADKSARC